MSYIKRFPEDISFSQDGLNGYKCSLETKNIGLVIEDCYKGHEKYCINKVTTHIYYVLEGEGLFSIDGKKYNVKKEDVIEIPPNTEFVFAGKMKLLLVNTPDFKPEDSVSTRNNDLY
jgi:gentisate 1,2-dioxygenase